MAIKATRGVDNELRLYENEPYRMLVYAMIKRFYRDSTGRVGSTNGQSETNKLWHVRCGIEFMNGPEFRHWCELLGVEDPDRMLQLIDERVGATVKD